MSTHSYPYMALNEHNYIPLTETQLRMCDKMGSTYYCQNSYVLHQRTQHTCESAIYYKMDAKTITKHCQAKFAANVEFTPKVLDAGETMVLLVYQDHGFFYVVKKNGPLKLKSQPIKL